jgi:nucleotide-binding universal stress UspA family protein
MSDPIRTIVAGISSAAEDDLTLVAAAELASWTGAALHLVHTYEVPPVFTPMEPGYAVGEWTSYFAEDLHPRLEAAVRRLAPGVESVCSVVPGPPAGAILAAAREAGADLVVVGAAHAGRLVRTFLGTTAQRVLRGSTVPVLVVRRPLRHPLERVLLAADLSESGRALHVRGMETVAAAFGRPSAVRVLHVVAFPHVGTPIPQDAVETRTREALERYLGELPPAPCPVTPVVRIGEAADRIAREVELWDADLLVVGTHAHGWAARLRLGSVGEAAVRDARCNVLAVPPEPLAEAGAQVEAGRAMTGASPSP